MSRTASECSGGAVIESTGVSMRAICVICGKDYPLLSIYSQARICEKCRVGIIKARSKMENEEMLISD